MIMSFLEMKWKKNVEVRKNPYATNMFLCLDIIPSPWMKIEGSKIRIYPSYFSGLISGVFLDKSPNEL